MVAPLWKIKRVDDPEYIDWIKEQRCLGCDREGYVDDRGVRQGIAPHHQPKEGHGAKGLKAGDDRAVPACTPSFGVSGCHAKFHASPGTFWPSVGVDIEYQISRLNLAFFAEKGRMPGEGR